jgi:hypothetical protein
MKKKVLSSPTQKMLDLMKIIESDECKQHVILYYLPEEEENILEDLKAVVYYSPRGHSGEMFQIKKEIIKIKMVDEKKILSHFEEDLIVEISGLILEDIWKIGNDYNPETIQLHEEPDSNNYSIYVPLRQIDNIGVKKEN